MTASGFIDRHFEAIDRVMRPIAWFAIIGNAYYSVVLFLGGEIWQSLITAAVAGYLARRKWANHKMRQALIEHRPRFGVLVNRKTGEEVLIVFHPAKDAPNAYVGKRADTEECVEGVPEEWVLHVQGEKPPAQIQIVIPFLNDRT